MRWIGSRTVVVMLGLAGATWANGLLIPKDKSIPPLAIKHQRVSVEIDSQVARTHVKQVFQNSVNRDLEAVYVFPLPKGAAISEFAMWIDGKRVTGELLEKDKAARIYQSIVSRMRDPGLLEYMGNNLLRVRVYPVPRRGEQQIEVKYAQVIKLDGGLARYVYPLRTGQLASRTLEDFSMAVLLRSKLPLKSIYSPSHKVSVTRKSDHEATVGCEEEQSLLDRDFNLYYTVSKKDFGLHLLTHRPKARDGYFMLMISPKVEVSAKEVMDKDMCFVLDTSGSMAGEKIKRAREALKYCVRSLRPRDRFNIIRFSTDAEAFAKDIVPADSKHVQDAVAFVDRIEARGGTNIDAALAQALDVKADPKRTYTVVFLTDGRPTIGETATDNIVKNVAGRNKANTRIFVFGVGDSVNTHLLDRISSASHGYPEYVKPNEEIETKVSLFFDKVRHPVLTNLNLDFGKADVYDLYPRELPDLFQGMQLTLFGRYKGAASTAIQLCGVTQGKGLRFAYDAELPAKQADNGFIPKLWTSRKIGYLLDEIRLHGENKELKDEVIRLSKEHGIATPYTSYLVVEDESEIAADADRGRQPRPRPMTAGRRLHRTTMDSNIPAIAPARRRLEGASMKQTSGREAVRVSEAIQSLKRAEADEGARRPMTVRVISGRTFRFAGSVWVEDGIKRDMPLVKIRYASPAYFALWQAMPGWREILKLGAAVRFVANGKVIDIGDEGKDALSAEELRDLAR